MATSIKLRLKLRMVASVDFRHGVLHHYDELRRNKYMDDVRADECVLLVSHTGRRLAFVYKETKLTTKSGDPVTAVTSIQLALDRHVAWNPLMLANYAEQCGIELIGIKRFEQHLEEVAAERAEERKAS